MTWLDSLLQKAVYVAGVLINPLRPSIDLVAGEGIDITGVDDPVNKRTRLEIKAEPGSTSSFVWKEPVHAAQTDALPANTLTNPNLITANANGALTPIDGLSLAAGEYVMLWLESGAKCGIWEVAHAGNVSTPFSFTRRFDADEEQLFVSGMRIPVRGGTAYRGAIFEYRTPGSITLGTTALEFTPNFIANGGELGWKHGQTISGTAATNGSNANVVSVTPTVDGIYLIVAIIFGKKLAKVMTGNPALTFAEVGATGDTITRATGDWQTDGFAVGDRINVSGSASNDFTNALVTGVTSTVLTLDTQDLTAEGPVSNVVVTADAREVLVQHSRALRRRAGTLSVMLEASEPPSPSKVAGDTALVASANIDADSGDIVVEAGSPANIPVRWQVTAQRVEAFM